MIEHGAGQPGDSDDVGSGGSPGDSPPGGEPDGAPQGPGIQGGDAPEAPPPPPPPAEAYAAPEPQGYGEPPPGGALEAQGVQHKGHEERRALLAQNLQQAAARGMRVESQTDYQAVLVEGKPINHTLHAILTVFTCLVWGIVWAVIAATGGEKKHQLVIDDFGNVHWQNLGKV